MPEVETLLPAASDISDEDFSRELRSVEAKTAVEREWIDKFELDTFPTDIDILEAAKRGVLRGVDSNEHFTLIQRLEGWRPERSRPDHAYHYSPPFLRPYAREILKCVAAEWANEFGDDRVKLSVTSLVRSNTYQEGLRVKDRKLTIISSGLKSSHQVGIAFDIDGSGQKRLVEGRWVPNNPRVPGYDRGLALDVTDSLVSVLQSHGPKLNFVRELEGTADECFHIAVNPSQAVT